jgi:aspartate racemase
MQEAIIEEMSVGVFTEETKARCLQMIDSFSDQGAEAVILGCTEIPLLLRNTNPSIPTIDSLTCHCEKIVSFILEDELSGPSKDFTSSIL